MPSASKSGMIAAAALLIAGGMTAGIAWWYNLARTRQALAYWGTEAVDLVRDAPRVTAYRVAFDREAARATSDNPAFVHPQSLAPANVLDVRNISHARGLVHLRHALLDDRSIAWSEHPAGAGDVDYILTFEKGESRLVVFFPGDFAWMAASGGTARHRDEFSTVSTRPIAAGLREYFADVFR